MHYLCKKAACEPFAVPIIAEVELYRFDPWDLPEKALFGEKEWYFFSPRDRKYPNGSRPNRAAGAGYWKATGTDKPISTMGGAKKVGVKKALVFYQGKAPKGVKTNWIMHEYRLADCGALRQNSAKRKASLRLDDWVLCRIYKKSSSAAMQVKLESIDEDTDVKTEQSESSSFDNVLATLSELDNPAPEAEEVDHDVPTDMQDIVSTETRNNFYQQEVATQYASGDLGAYIRELESRAGIVRQVGNGGDKIDTARAAASYESRQSVTTTVPVVVTPESIVRSQQHSPLESYSTSGQQEEEDMAGDTTFNSLAGSPKPQPANTSLNPSNLAFQPNNHFYGLDLGLPSPCSMLANGGFFGGGSFIDPDNYLVQPSLGLGFY